MIQVTQDRRAQLEAELAGESRSYLASYVLFNQAVADHLGLHPTDVQAISLITAAPEPLTVKRIAEVTGLTTGSATRLVDRLERGGYVTRQPDERDRRRVLVVAVPARMARVRAVWDDLRPGWQAMFADLSDAELEVLIRHMRRAQQLSRTQMERLRAAPARP
ncbi:MarR family transcriptional regulator [Longispora sp. K20-0274]|uniref:MarR family winged helix-turn-helix transcriptional regulator n=1 Tax=Longispora sp. K20-0274 TaxID=3088255 RepID=UPI00399B3743